MYPHLFILLKSFKLTTLIDRSYFKITKNINIFIKHAVFEKVLNFGHVTF